MPANIGMSLTWLSFFTLLLGVVLRGVWAGRVPWGNMYEFSITAALGILGVFLGMSIRRDLRWLGLFVVTPALLRLGLAVTVLYTEAAQLVPALKSYWLVIHVSAAIICSGAFTFAAATAGLSLVRGRLERKAGTTDDRRLGRHGADQRAAAGADEPRHRLRLPAVDVRRRGGRHLGGERLGPLLGLGSEGDVGVHHVGRLRGLPARPLDGRMARQPGLVDRGGRLARRS